MSMKLFPLIIAAISIILAIGVHFYMPKTEVDNAIEQIAEEVVKDETGIEFKMT